MNPKVKREPHAPLECPECGKLCEPRRETPDGGATYLCRNTEGHADFRALSFAIDSDGEVHF